MNTITKTERAELLAEVKAELPEGTRLYVVFVRGVPATKCYTHWYKILALHTTETGKTIMSDYTRRFALLANLPLRDSDALYPTCIRTKYTYDELVKHISVAVYNRKDAFLYSSFA